MEPLCTNFSIRVSHSVMLFFLESLVPNSHIKQANQALNWVLVGYEAPMDRSPSTWEFSDRMRVFVWPLVFTLDWSFHMSLAFLFEYTESSTLLFPSIILRRTLKKFMFFAFFFCELITLLLLLESSGWACSWGSQVSEGSIWF